MEEGQGRGVVREGFLEEGDVGHGFSTQVKGSTWGSHKVDPGRQRGKTKIEVRQPGLSLSIARLLTGGSIECRLQQ